MRLDLYPIEGSLYIQVIFEEQKKNKKMYGPRREIENKNS